MSYIDWQTDPLLLDPKPMPMNEWLTANKILSMDRPVTSLFVDMDKLILNIFPILVRKIDFVREKDSDRVLSRFPFLVLTKEEKEIIKSKLLLVAEFSRDYFYKSINGRISDWTKRLETYLKRGAMPYPLFRCACEITALPLIRPNVDSLEFESARGKKYTIPIKLTNQIAYLCGVCNGDGNLRKHFINIVDETKEHIEFLSKLLQQMFATISELFQTGNAWVVEVHSSAVSRLINFLTDHTIDGAKYDSLQEPLLFKKLGEPFRKYYWGGAMDADGSFLNSISFISASDKFVKDFQEYLELVNISSKATRINDIATSLYIPAKHKVNFCKLIGVLNPKKARDYQKLLESKTDFYEFKSINKNKLTAKGYFKFEMVQSLLIIGLRKYLADFRNGRNFTTMREMLELSAGSYASFERNERAIPFSLFLAIIKEQNKETEEVYEILKNLGDDLRFQISSSNLVKFPLKISEVFENILQYLEPRINYTNVLTEDEEIVKLIESFFDIKIENKRITSRPVVNFLRTFCSYEKKDNCLSLVEFKLLQQKWRDNLFTK